MPHFLYGRADIVRRLGKCWTDQIFLQITHLHDSFLGTLDLQKTWRFQTAGWLCGTWSFVSASQKTRVFITSRFILRNVGCNALQEHKGNICDITGGVIEGSCVCLVVQVTWIETVTRHRYKNNIRRQWLSNVVFHYPVAFIHEFTSLLPSESLGVWTL